MSTITKSELLNLVSEPHLSRAVDDDSLDQVDDGSSSSLSEPDDRTGNEDGDDAQDAEADGSDGFDTEAETERLEKTPRKQRNVLLTSPNKAFPRGEGFLVEVDEQGASLMGEDRRQTPDSSLGEIGDEDDAPQNSSSLRKRKRADYKHKSQEGGDAERHATGNIAKLSTPPSPDESLGSPTPQVDDESDLRGTRAMQPTSKQNNRKGKRKGKKLREAEDLSKGEREPRPGYVEDAPYHSEAASSNGEDVEMEDIIERDGADADSIAKTEEDLSKKRTAMESLSAMENCFATLRDKLFDERLAQCNEELAMLKQPIFIHPELLLMKEVIDRRRDQKIKYEQTLLKYKLESLQRESIANKAQMHSQYMQTVGELRDMYLSQINAEIYQTQRERRSCEADIPDYLYAFTSKRSKQITEQTAYNEEVSLLSGIAKYVGFPAAPDILTARSNEWEEDERAYKHKLAVEDEAIKARRASQHRPSVVRASLSAASTFGRPQPAAEVQFLQQNAWANPQHPVHRKDRQGRALVSVAISSATPTPHKRPFESHRSSVPEHPSTPNCSGAPNPAMEGGSREVPIQLNASASQNLEGATPSRITGRPTEERPLNARPAEQPLIDAPNGAEKHPSPLSFMVAERESHTPGALPKPLPSIENGETSRASPPVRNPIIKAEGPSNVYHHTPISHEYQGTPPTIAASNGR